MKIKKLKKILNENNAKELKYIETANNYNI